MQRKIFTLILMLAMMPIFLQAQRKEPLSITQLAEVKAIKSLFKGKVKADYVFTSSPFEAGKLPKNPKTRFTTAEPVYAAIKYEKPVDEWNYRLKDDGFNITTELYVGGKKLGEAVTFFTVAEYNALLAKEKVVSLEIIPGENTLQYNSKYIKLLENIAELEPGIITVKVKGSYAKTDDEITFTLDATNIAKDKDRLLRIAERIRNNKKDMKELVRQHDKKIWILPEPQTKDPRILNEVRAALKSNLGINATHVVLQYNDWLVYTHPNTGIPTLKKMSVTYAWKEKGECWISYDNAYCDYLGGGKYSKIRFERRFEDHLVDCNNLK